MVKFIYAKQEQNEVSRYVVKLLVKYQQEAALVKLPESDEAIMGKQVKLEPGTLIYN